uniref:ParB/Sulfiredoxin domain-containing protein n=2 Tax=Pseudo-nitzschia australis TaxID=44445 RepID=A0A7S4ACC8_9STRA
MKIPPACNTNVVVVLILATAAVVVRGFSVASNVASTRTTNGWSAVHSTRTSSSRNQFRWFATADQVNNEDATKDTDASGQCGIGEEMARRNMLAARLRNEKKDLVPVTEEKEDEDSDATDGEESETATASEKDEDIVGDANDSEQETPSKTEATETEAKPTEAEGAIQDLGDGDTADPSPDADPESPTSASTISSTTPNSEKDDDDRGIKLEIVAEVAANIAKEVAVDLLSFIRFGAANILTSSLPETQRQELLQRMGARTLPPAGGNTAKDAGAAQTGTEPEEKRASIREEIALARAEEAQTNEKRWRKEKEDIVRQMEVAANARVEDELKIQQMRLEEEREEALKEKETELESERKRFLLLEEEREKNSLAKESSDDGNAEVSDLFVAKTEEEEEQNRQLEELMKKRKKQQIALESIEEELRASVANEAEERDRLNSLLEKRKEQQSELTAVEANLRVQVAATEAEKAQYAQLLAELDALKEKEQRVQQEIQTEQELSEEEATAADTDSDKEGGEEDQEHPILGPVIADLGYKRIHFVSAGRLGNIPVWNRNRIYRNNRAKAMAVEKAKSMELGFPGAICLHESAGGKLSIVDGQHRVGMMTALKTAFNKKVEKGEDLGGLKHAEKVFEKVLVEVYPEKAEGDKFAEKVFLEINKAEPVKLIDMPGVASVADRKIITEAVAILYENYPTMFSPSQRCRIPNVNVDNLRSAIFGSNILKRHQLKTSKKLVEWLLETNTALGLEYENSKEKQKLVSSKKQWDKASANSFYLGLEGSWLYK